MPDTQDSNSARVAGRYALIERLHAGSQTELWLATDERAGIPVAIKQLAPDAAAHPERRALFEREWRIARSLNHPHTVRALAEVDSELPAYAMQYIDGTDFAALVGQSLDVWGPAVLVIVDTLDYWHRKGVVHGDIKPANCLLDRRGVAYLGDFGCAEIIDEHAEPGARGCSAAYASPEQQEGLPAAADDDVFALAQMIAELATGNPAAAFPDSLPAGLKHVLDGARQARGQRPNAKSLRDAFAAAGIERGEVDVRALAVDLRRPAASLAVTAEPVEALPHGAFERGVSPRSERQRDGVSPQWVIGGLLLIIGLGVVTVTVFAPEDGATPAAVTTPAATTPATSTPATPAATTDPKADPEPPPDPAARDAADEWVAELLRLVEGLEARSAAEWGGAVFENGMSRYAEGDRAYLARDYAEAEVRYREALDQLRPLYESIDARYTKAMRDADSAMLAGDADAARAAYELGLLLRPADAIATLGLERAGTLNEVLRLVAEARVAEGQSDFTLALARIREALSLNPDWIEAQQTETRLLTRIRDDAFAADMSRGFEALDQGDFGTARAAFNAAARLRPDDPGTREALLQVNLGERLRGIGALQQQAEAASAEGRWQAALTAYESMLSIDDSLDIARDGVLLAKSRLSLLGEIDAVLSNPDQLSDTDALRAASALLERALEQAAGDPAVTGRTDSLTRLLTTVAIPISVQLRSDGQTSVTLLRVARLGTFESKEVNLRPGLYTIVGSRRGYQDERRQFRIVAGEQPPSVYIACERPI